MRAACRRLSSDSDAIVNDAIGFHADFEFVYMMRRFVNGSAQVLTDQTIYKGVYL